LAPDVRIATTNATLSLEIRAFMTKPLLSLRRKDNLGAGGHHGQTKLLRQLGVPPTIGEEMRKDQDALAAPHAQNTKC
jgi:hypothetical protein